MSLKFLVAILEWLQEEFVKTNDRHLERVQAYNEKIKELSVARQEEQEKAVLAKRLASKIDDLLSA